MKTRVYLLTIPDKIISNDISKRYEEGFIFFFYLPWSVQRNPAEGCTV